MRPASSPIIDGDSFFVAFDNCYGQYVVALDKDTGKTLWKKDREIEFEPEGPTNDENERSDWNFVSDGAEASNWIVGAQDVHRPAQFQASGWGSRSCVSSPMTRAGATSG